MSPHSTLPPPAQARLQLVVNTGLRSDIYPLYDDSVVSVGRDSDNVIRIEDASVSRRHLELHAAEDGALVVDLGSSNGTLLVRTGGLSDEEAGPGTAHRLPPHQPVPLRVGESVRVGPALIFLQVKTRTSQSALGARRAAGVPPVLVDAEMKNAYDLLSRAAQSEVSVLIFGETGVGKEMMAESVHRRSRRAHRPYLQLNCAALPETLLESELFGHEKGAFTGAHVAKVGLLESTDGGTVFLDEIGELSLGTQAKLLRVLEERTLLRVGGTKSRRISVRFVTATNRDLVRECREGRFRSDLYYRISGLVVRIPPLRQRPSEIGPLTRHFLRQFCKNIEQPEPLLTPEALALLLDYDWPGNVRELRNVIERSALLAGREPIRAEHVLLDPPPSEPNDSEPDALTEVIDRASLRSPLESLGAGRVSLGAGRESLGPGRESLGIPRASLGSGRESIGVARESIGAGRESIGIARESLSPSTPTRTPRQAEPASSGRSRIPKSLNPSLLDPEGRAAQLDAERARLITALDECGGNQTRAALRLGISRRQLISLIEFWQLPRPKKR